MKQLFNISSNFAFYLFVAFLLLIPFSIAACYLLFSILLIQMIVSYILHLKIPRTQRKPFLVLPPYYKYFLLFIFFTIISTIFSIAPLNSLKDNKEFFIFLFIPLTLRIIDTPKRLLVTLNTILASGVISALFGCGEAIFVKGITTQARIDGAVSHWMTYAGLLMFIFIFYLVYFFYEKHQRIRWLVSGALLIILVPILLSLTRSVWVGIVVAIGFFFVYFKPRLLFLVIPAIILLAIVLPQSVKSRVTSIFDLRNETSKDRLYMFQVAMNIFQKHPLTGVGPNSIEKVYDTYKPPEAKLNNPHLHNNFLHILAERGIFSLLALIAAFYSIIFHLIQKIKTAIHFEKTLALGVLFMFIGFLVSGLFEYNFGDTEIKFMLFYFISLPFLKLKDTVFPLLLFQPTPVQPGEEEKIPG